MVDANSLQDFSRQKALQFLDDHLWPQRAQQLSGVPGLAVAVVFAGDAAPEIRCYGVRDVRQPELAVDPDTVFALASVSKPITSTVIAALVGDGVLSWDDPIQQHLPEFAVSDPQASSAITMAEMLAHRSGLPDHAGDLLEDLGYSRAEIITRMRHLLVGPRPAPHRYTNLGFSLAAFAAAQAWSNKTKQTLEWEELAEQRLYQRLGMTRTSSRHATFTNDPNCTVGHQRFARNPGQCVWLPAADPRNADAQTPAGGVRASISDVARWLQLQLNHGRYGNVQVVDSAALRHTHSAFPSAKDSHYGLGWNVKSDSGDLTHSGAFATGAATCVAVLPKLGVGLAVLTNGEPIGVPETLGRLFVDHLRTLSGLPASELQPYLQSTADMMRAMMPPPSDRGYSQWQSPPPRPLEQYAGRYQHPYFGTVQIATTPSAAAHPTGLSITFLTKPAAAPIALTPWKADAFTYPTFGENAVGLSAVEFAPLASGPARLRVMNLHYADKTADYAEADADCPEVAWFQRVGN
ncbi:MAG: serine hydrolase [Leptothrix sp. (in: b-proteobacteria)]